MLYQSPLTAADAAFDIRAMRARIVEIERWLRAADDMFTGTSFQSALDIAEAETAACETEILYLCDRFGINEEPYGEAA